jgi:methyl-accepting chemotaxis protein
MMELERVADSEVPIKERIRLIIPPAEKIAKTLELDAASAERIKRLMDVIHDELVELAQDARELSTQADQAVTDSTDAMRAQDDAAASQKRSAADMQKVTRQLEDVAPPEEQCDE